MSSLWADVQRAGRHLVREPRLVVPMVVRAAGMARAAWLLRGCEVGARVSVMGPVELENRGRVRLGDRVYFLPGMLPSRITVHEGAELTVGEFAGFNFGVAIEATTRVSIGERTMLASLVTVRDAQIGADVWVAHGATISAGVTVGEGSVVSAGTTVTRDVPPYHLAIGEPARNVRLDTLSRGARH